MKDTRDDSGDADSTNTTDDIRGNPVSQEANWELVGQRPIGAQASTGLTTTIIKLVADAEGIAPRKVKHPPLYEIVDTAALEAAFVSAKQRSQELNSNMSTEFFYRGFRVVVTSDGWVKLYEPGE